MPAQTKKDTSADILASRLKLDFAEEERFVKSWFSTFNKNVNVQSPGSDEDNIEDDFRENDDESGLGHVAPEDQSLEARQSLSANERLRKQLLGGSSSGSMMKVKTSSKMPTGLQASKPRPQSKRTLAIESDDEDEARTFSTTRRSKKTTTTPVSDSRGLSRKEGPTAKSANYLDELLAKRASKQKRSR